MPDFIPMGEQSDESALADKPEGLYVGEYASPEKIEGILIQSEFLQQVLIISDKSKAEFVIGIFVLNKQFAMNFAQKR